jgi:teichuronic acid biosynthesis protein TuaE
MRATRFIKYIEYCRDINYLKYIWLLTLISAYAGPYLSWYRMPNLFAYRLLMLIHVILFGVIFILNFFRGQEIKWNVRVQPYFLFLGLWFIWGLISLFWAPSVFSGMKHLVYLGAGCLVVFFTVFYFATADDLNTFFLINILVLIGEIALGIWELKSGYHLYGSFPRYYLRHNFLPIIGTFGHPNNFATYLSMFLPLLYVWGKNHKNKGVMIFSLGLLALGLYLILCSTSRANMLAVILGVVLVLAFFLIRSWKQFFPKLRQTVFITAFILALLIPTTRYFFEPAINQIKEEVTSVFVNWEYDGSIQLRKTLIYKGWDMFKESNGLGVGPGNAEFLMQQFREETFGYLKMHNWWVEVLVDYGLFIWILLLLFFAGMVRDLFKVFRTSGDQSLRMWAEGLLISLAMFSVGVISNGSMMTSAHLWILLGGAICVINVHRLRGKEEKSA